MYWSIDQYNLPDGLVLSSEDFMYRSLSLAMCGLVTAIWVAQPVHAAEFKWAAQGEAQTLDPHATTEFQTMAFIGNIYEPLIRRNKDLGLEPALAESWQLTSPTVWRFNLRKGVTFHDGAPFTADDVLSTYERSRSPGADAKTKVQSITDIKKIDDHTIEITTAKPSPVLLAEISDWFMTSKGWVEKNDAKLVADVRKGAENYATRNANGTGPFKLISREPDVKTVLEANPNWWDKPAHNVTRATFMPISNSATRMAALLSGEIDFALPVPTQDIKRLKAEPNINVIQGTEARVIFLGFDHKRDELLYGSVKEKNPFKDIRVRKAFNQAVDINAIVSKIMDGAAAARGALIVRQMKGFTPDLDKRPSFDVAAAKKLLADAGYPDGFSVTLDCPNDRYVNDEAVCVAVAAMLGRIGVKVNVAAISKTKYFTKTLSRDTSFFMLGWGANTVDAHNPLAVVFGTPTPEGNGQWNMGAYSNPKLDAMALEIRDELDETKRNAMIKEAYQMVNDDFVIIPLFEPALVWATRKNVTLDQRADERFELRSVVKK
jgi:peptide/nickel transport system substrate-binding protein